MFKNSFRLPFRLLGIPVYLDVTFLIILPLLAWLIGAQMPELLQLMVEFELLPDDPELLAPVVEGWTPYLLGLAAAVGLFVSVVIHELGHAMTGRVYGVETERITLWLLGGMAHFKEMPKQKGAEAVVAIAGPITSFVLGAIFFAVLGFVPLEAIGVFVVIYYLAIMNILLAVFNMIPALPLDGGRVLRSVLHLKMSRLRATQISAGISRALAIALGLFGLLAFNLFLILIAFFIYMAVTAEAKYAMFTEVLSRFDVSALMTRPVSTVPPHMPVGQVLDKMMSEARLAYPVKAEDGEIVGQITLDKAQIYEPEMAVGEVMEDGPEVIDMDTDASELFERMIRDDQHRLLVVDPEGFVVGIITKTDLMRALQIASSSGTRTPPGPGGMGRR